MTLGLMPAEGRDLVRAGAIISILLKPVVFALIERRLARGVPVPAPTTPEAVRTAPPVGAPAVALAPAPAEPPMQLPPAAESGRVPAARRDGAEVIVGNAADPQVLALANLAAARCLLVTIPGALVAGQVVQQARVPNPGVEILAPAHSGACVRHLNSLGASRFSISLALIEAELRLRLSIGWTWLLVGAYAAPASPEQ